jgi:polyisoprenyl-phosphate glycosyltransferase
MSAPAASQGGAATPNEDAEALWILIPTYNDWAALLMLLQSLDAQLAADGLTARVLVVDDGSTISMGEHGARPMRAIAYLGVMRLRRNLGHQRAIAVGLCFLAEQCRGRGVIVMDGDGEDRPEDIVRLLAASRQDETAPAAFAARLRRSEGITFTVFYHLYRLAHRIVTGYSVRMGNFSYLPWQHAERLVVCGELWNHYAASVIHSKTPFRLTACPRGKRLAGTSGMTSVGLVAHGLSAMAVYADRIGVRALAASAVALILSVVALAGVLFVKFGTTLALPGWATTAAGLLLVIVAELVMLSMLFTFVVLSGRSQTTVIPLRDYRYFAGDVKCL